MKALSITVFLISLIFAVLAEAQSKESEYLAVLEPLDVADLRMTLMSVGPHGLNPKFYWTDMMESTYVRGPADRGLKNQAKINYLRLLQDIFSGVVDPDTMGTDIKLEKKPFLTAKQLNAVLLANGTKAGPLFDSFAPRTAPYLALKEALRKISTYCLEGQWQPLPRVKKELKLGVKSPLVPALKARFAQLGYSIPTTDDLFDGQMLAAVNDIQWMLRFKPDGKISPDGKTWRYLSTSCEERARQIRLDMEKLRWLPQDFEDRYIFINLAMSYFSLVDRSNGFSLHHEFSHDQRTSYAQIPHDER